MKKAIYAQKAEAIIERITAIEDFLLPSYDLETVGGFIVDPRHKIPNDTIYDIMVDLELLLFKFSRFYPSLYEIRKLKTRHDRCSDDYYYDYEDKKLVSLRTIVNKFIDFLKDE